MLVGNYHQPNYWPDLTSNLLHYVGSRRGFAESKAQGCLSRTLRYSGHRDVCLEPSDIVDIESTNVANY